MYKEFINFMNSLKWNYGTFPTVPGQYIIKLYAKDGGKYQLHNYP